MKGEWCTNLNRYYQYAFCTGFFVRRALPCAFVDVVNEIRSVVLMRGRKNEIEWEEKKAFACSVLHVSAKRRAWYRLTGVWHRRGYFIWWHLPSRSEGGETR